MQFNFRGTHPEVSASSKKVIDAMVDAANGRPLPGRWGLVQSLCNVWTAAPPDPRSGPVRKALWTVKASLASVGVWSAYQESLKTVQKAKVDAFEAFREDNGLGSLRGFSSMTDLLHAASCATVPYEDLTLKDEKFYVIRKFCPPGGIPYYFKVFLSQSANEDYPSEGPLFPGGAEAEPAFRKVIRDVLWAQFRSHALRLTVQETYLVMGGFSQQSLDLSDAGAPDPYISDTSSEEWTNARVYATRCRAFMDRGLVRGVLFYGPPGTGKTSLAMNVLGDAGRVLKITSSAISRSDFTSIAGLIDVLDPRVILFDDIDRFGHSDLSAMLEYMEGLKKSPPKEGRIIVGTVNAIETLDPALLRAGRFDEVLQVPEPGAHQRVALCTHYVQFFGSKAEGLDPASLADRMDGFSPADIRSVIESVSCVGAEHLEAEIRRTRMQRTLFSGDKVLRYLSRGSKTSDDEADAVLSKD
jgi:hypothetical protein